MGRPATLRVDILTNARGDGVDQTSSKLGKLGKIGGAVGKAVGLGLAAAGTAAVVMGKRVLDSASRLEQSQGALRTVFGRSADEVDRWAKRAAGAVGLARSEYGELASVVGSQLQGMGIEQGKSAQRSKELIKLGADLSATYGGSVADAVGAVSSLMRGEADPIERYGVSIKAADVSARLAAQGLDGLTGKAEKQAKAQATLALLTEQTAKAQGAFRRESGTLANVQQRLGAKIENLQAKLGKKLLPVAVAVLGWANRMIPKISNLARTMGDRFGPTITKVGKFITGTLVPAGIQLHQWFVQKIAPGIKATLTPILEGARSAFNKVRDAVADNQPQLRKIWDLIKGYVEFVATKVMPVIGDLIGKGFDALGSAIGGTIDAVSWLTDKIGWLIDKVQDLIGWLRDLGDTPGINKILSLFNGGESVLTVRPQLAGRSPSYGGPAGGMTTAAAGMPSLSTLLRTTPSSGRATVQQTVVHITVEAGLSDPTATAKTIRKLLRAEGVLTAGAFG